MGYLFTSESVSEGHPDKVADQISDAVLDEMLRNDSASKVAVETLVTTGLAVVAGEVKTNGFVDIQSLVRDTINQIGYTKASYRFDGNSCGVLSAIHEQSPDINQGVERAVAEDQGAGDQGMMFGYACRETNNLMPLTSELAHIFLQELAAIRREGKQMKYLGPMPNRRLPSNMKKGGNLCALNLLSFQPNTTPLMPTKKECLPKYAKMSKKFSSPA